MMRNINLPPWIVLPAMTALLLIGAALVTSEITAGGLDLALDNSYIYCGYAKMAFVHGGGLFSYNIDQNTSGVTGLLYYYLLILVTGIIKTFNGHAIPAPSDLVAASMVIAGLCLLAILLSAARTFWAEGIEPQGAGSNETAAKPSTGLSFAVAFTAFCALGFANPDTLWGINNGLESPLTTLLCVLLAADTLAGSRSLIKTGLLFGALVCCRPEWLPVAVISIIVLSIQRLRKGSSGAAVEVFYAFDAFVGFILVVFSPMRVLTGKWLPRTFGYNVPAYLPNIPQALANLPHLPLYWSIAAAVCLVIGIWAARRCGVKTWAFPAIVLLYYFVHTGIWADLPSIRDRYLSYTTPGLALCLVVSARALIADWSRRRTAADNSHRRWAYAGAAGLLGIGFIYSASLSFTDLSRDILETHRTAVSPAIWMQANWPSQSRVCMGRPGAIRVYTDFELVDRTGLVTTDLFYFLQGRAWNYEDFLGSRGVHYVFDYPGVVPIADIPDVKLQTAWASKPYLWTDGPLGCFKLPVD